MIVNLNMLDENLNETANNFTFKDGFQMVSDHGYASTLQSCYGCFVNENLIFHANSFGGFFDNLPIEATTTVGVGEIGSKWQGNYLGARILTITFENVTSVKTGLDVSPNELLSYFVSNPNQYVKVTAITDGTPYYIICYFNDDTSLETGSIVLQSAFPDDNAFWNSSAYSEEEKFYKQRPTIPMKLEQVLLADDWYPLKKVITSAGTQPLNIKVGGDFNGTWSYFNVKLNGTELKCTKGTGEYLIIDSSNGQILDENGNNLVGNVEIISGDRKALTLIPGINEIEITIDGKEEIQLLKNMPTNMIAEFQYKSLHNSIPGGKAC